MRPPPHLRRRLADLATRPVNYDADALDLAHPPSNWNVDRRSHPLGIESPGDPEPEGSWEIATRLIRGYEFADPSLVRAYYDPDRPLQGREMLLQLRALNLFHVYVGVRVVHVYDETRTEGDRQARVFGWAYRTLQGHVECGQMDWQVWKWPDSGAVQFRVHAVSRTAHIANPFVRIGFWALRDHERRLFLDSTGQRMAQLTRLGLEREGRGDRLRRASPQLTARRLSGDDPAHEQLARHADEG